ncbi:MAG: HAD family phosphatase, partial [Deltaproteobacteria bacterium]|nr:HAD family phosphatase [Deltaproteobacteria bacterium]
DLDGTLTRERSAWEYLHRRLGLWEGYAEKFQEAFLRGEIDYHRFCELDAALWKGMKVTEALALLKEIPLYEGVEEFVALLRTRGVKTGIISTGLSLLAEWIKVRYGFDAAVANELGSKNGVLTGEIRILVHHDSKGEWAERAKEKFQAKTEEVLAIGDSSGDIGMFQMAGMTVAFNSRSAQLDCMATLSIRSLDLRDIIPQLLPHLG